MKQQLAILLFILISCSPIKEKHELKVLKEIIERDFNESQTHNKLIPIDIQHIENYTFYSIDQQKQITNSKPKFAELAPKQNRREYVSIGFIPFYRLIRNSQISQIQFDKLVTESNLKKGITTEITTNSTTKKNFNEIMSSKSIDNYQEFGYPILTDSTLIVYRNIYQGIKNSGDLGLTGNGTYFIYSKLNQKWVLIDKITKWIT